MLTRKTMFIIFIFGIIIFLSHPFIQTGYSRDKNLHSNGAAEKNADYGDENTYWDEITKEKAYYGDEKSDWDETTKENDDYGDEKSRWDETTKENAYYGDENSYSDGATEGNASYRYENSLSLIDQIYKNREAHRQRRLGYLRQFFGSSVGHLWERLYWNRFWDNYHRWRYASDPNANSRVSWYTDVPVIIDGPYRIKVGYRYTILGNGFGNRPGSIYIIQPPSRRVLRLKLIAWCDTAVQFEVPYLPIGMGAPLKARIRIITRNNQEDMWPMLVGR